MKDIILQEIVEQRIFMIRSRKVMIDRDLADLYGVETKHLNRQVRRNKARFPEEFMFQLTSEEKNELVTNCHRFETMKHSSVLPYAFNEHGVAMLASVLNSDQAVKISVGIIKAFVRLREMLSAHRELASKLATLERKIESHDESIRSLFEAIRELTAPPPEPPKKIGFVKEKGVRYGATRKREVLRR